MQTVKMRPPIPLYVLVIIGVIIVGLILLVLSLLHIVDLTFLGDGVVWFLTAPLMWGSASWYAAVTFYILGFGAVAFICFLIAKRRYLISQKVLVSSTPAYEPRGQELTSTPTPAVAQPKEETA